ncbi:fatty acid oxidation complex subunit alpha FadB [Amphritea japonica]|uniref:enoyl-CoA hydratase n=1 Tax=Amphritea japonica ATCC BAA-1530 TaxID=1278309 RepID=A0A7R6STV9_9GAMM|nr:fatty acid oxidation complex subunit alpha FadB [Amphritea japonica]BBB27120.1 3-hydroxyacyl-CoA dehydrogenase/enoyl-CoA hydratase/3-hydroxybutyryl-CoA epimerase/enoyl-CoA isomerase [Amphritea japonica ATCC BAA-1530]
MYIGSKLNVKALDNGLIELSFDVRDGSVNVFNNETVVELSAALEVIEKAEGIKGMLVTSAKSDFIVGADISEFKEIFSLSEEQIKSRIAINNTNFSRLESLSFPVVVAINGFALGGGLEFCLACDYRVMSDKAVISLPETGLGILPGWGGTVRTPRLVGLETALQWVASGAPQKAPVALESGLVSKVAEVNELRQVALELLNYAIDHSEEVQIGRIAKASALSISSEEAQQLAQAVKGKVCARNPQLLAPAAAIDLIAEASQLSSDKALEKEANVCAALATTSQSRALIGNFMNDQYIKKVARAYAKDAKLTLDKTTVVGAGIMGGGIAYQNALKGIKVVMKDIGESALDLGMTEADKLLSKRVRLGRMTEGKKADILKAITPTLEASDMDRSKVIVEAVVENPKVKEAVLAELENNLAEGGVLVSNTSTISITRLARALKRPDQFAGLHFFNPVHAMPLVEVVRAEQSSDQTISDLVAYTLALGKQPIVVNDCPAFLVNRVLFPYFRGFEQLINDGGDFQRIDQVMQAWGWPMGPAYLSDVIGIDTLCHCIDVLAQDFPDRMAQLDKSILNDMNTAERFGQKNGKGFYQYLPDAKGRPQKSVDDTTSSMIAQCQSAKVDLTDEEIEFRCMLPMAIEMARCLEEGIVDSPAEADMALLMGLGFPAFRGGVVRWMDEVGMTALCQWGDRLASTLGEAYRPTANMRIMAADSISYY